MSILQKTASELLSDLNSRKLSSREIVDAFLARIRANDSKVGAFLSLDEGGARAKAQSIDDARAKGTEVGSLAGVPLALKDVICTKGWKTTCASKMLANFCPPYDATVTKRLQDAGAILVGKTNMDEFAMGGSTENSAFQLTRNPWDLERVPGGSSGGAAACLAANMAPLSIGTDTGGSIRQPAAFCGVVGLKPTYGRVSRYGLVAFASSLDQIGPMARTCEDAALLLDTIAGHDPKDSTSAPVPTPSYRAKVAERPQSLRIGVVKEHYGEGLDPEIAKVTREAIDTLEKLGATIKDISLPHAQFGIATYYIIAPSEASSNLARYEGAHYGLRTNEADMIAELETETRSLKGDQKALLDLDTPLVRMYRKTRAEGFGPEVKRRIMLGTYTLSAGYYDAYYKKALQVRRMIRNDYDLAFQDVDVIVGPTTPNPAFKIGEKASDPLTMYLEDLYTVTANLAGLPAISIPCGFTKAGLPIGLQLQGKSLDELTLLQIGHAYQLETDWHKRSPSL